MHSSIWVLVLSRLLEARLLCGALFYVNTSRHRHWGVHTRMCIRMLAQNCICDGLVST